MKTALKPLSSIPKKLQEFVLELQQKIADKDTTLKQKDTRITQLEQDYQYALPLYRQETMFKQYGIELNRKKIMSAWMIRSSQLLMPVYERLITIQLQQSVINADETPVKVINEDKINNYMWVYCTGADSLADPPPDNKQPR